MSTVSIVMATYNGEKFLREQIDSILANTFTDWTLEICDDCSTDCTLEIAQEYAEKYSDKIFIHENEKNLGVVTNFLEGAQRATGAYTMFCDQDDVWLPTKIETTLERMKKCEKKYLEGMPITVFTDAKVVDIRLRQIDASFYKAGVLDVKKTDLAHLLMENKLMGCTMMFNKAVRDKMHTLPSFARYHDWWVAIVTSAFGKICYFDKVTMLYRQHGGNVVGNKSFHQYAIEKIKDIKVQKQVLKDTQKQAWNFCELYEKELLEEQREILRDFAYLSNMNWFDRREKLFKHGYWKTGKIRNLGVVLLI